MSLMMENTDQDCQLTLTEIRMRVANIKSRWSDEERVQRATQGHSRRQQLAALVEDALVEEPLQRTLDRSHESPFSSDSLDLFDEFQFDDCEMGEWT